MAATSLIGSGGPFHDHRFEVGLPDNVKSSFPTQAAVPTTATAAAATTASKLIPSRATREVNTDFSGGVRI
jgi:hypothetical protein